MSESRLIERDNLAGAGFRQGGKDYEVLFNLSGPAGGHVKISAAETVILDKDLTTVVEPQAGFRGVGMDLLPENEASQNDRSIN
jgi:hypothetical protein